METSSKIVKKPKMSVFPLPDEMRIKLLYMAEKKFSTIAAITNYSVQQITSLVTGRGWVAERKKHRAQLALSTEAEIRLLQERKTRWVKGKINLLEDVNPDAEKILKAAAKGGDPRNFDAAIKGIDKLDQVYRRQTGMDKDKPGSGNPLQINLIIAQSFDPSQNKIDPKEAIDVEVEDVS